MYWLSLKVLVTKVTKLCKLLFTLVNAVVSYSSVGDPDSGRIRIRMSRTGPGPLHMTQS
jgi:hypothetical protein